MAKAPKRLLCWYEHQILFKQAIATDQNLRMVVIIHMLTSNYESDSYLLFLTHPSPQTIKNYPVSTLLTASKVPLRIRLSGVDELGG